MNEILKYEKPLYFPNLKTYLIHYVTQGEKYQLWKYITFLRNEEAASNKFVEYYWRRKKNRLGAKLGFVIDAGIFGKGLQIFHYGSVIVNCNARIGENCKIHGQVCIGNDGITDAAPIIGNNVDIGIGAKIIGDITIADDVRIGAGAIVTKSCLEKGATLVGMPAKPIHTGKGI